MRHWTLRRTLVVGIGALVALALLATGVATSVALRSFVYERLDAQVLETLQITRVDQGQTSGGPSQQNGGFRGDGPAPRIGTLHLVVDGGGTVIDSSYTANDGQETDLDADQIATIEAASLSDRTPTTVDLGGELGSFRLAQEERDGVRVTAGNSLEEVEATTSALTVILVSVAGSALLLVLLGLSFWVRRTLRPLDRVAAVAQRVAARPLAAGEVDIPERVAEPDTDPVTEVGRVGHSLNVLLAHIEDALRSRQHSEDQLRRFIADASHELRTPLASIRGYAQLSLGEGAPMTPTQQRAFDRIASESTRMADLVEDLLLLARLDAGQPLRREQVDLTLLAIDAVSDAHVADPGRTWLLDVREEDVVEVVGDDNRLRQVVANLLRNARTHTPPGTRVVTTLRRDEQHAVIEVVDDGPGIDPAVRQRLFERFARGDASRNRDAGSTGLGLSIAEAIVSAHAGSIAVASEPGRTAFTVRLPLG
ncbi:cell wall metabolism sensor histidine kinase WalK [Microbacterium sp. cf332]|uniref:sensor histidine kinase n=1 Tax=Microbacterium sp. cf332 TaxID=1761804 RepID=UPI00088BAACA|nr:ATP-binding protein [Microbacterium sp. cf332]SDQ52291.1 two-component system, OmpR family, sensor kinase [Microbacterium sp. cf332]